MYNIFMFFQPSFVVQHFVVGYTFHTVTMIFGYLLITAESIVNKCVKIKFFRYYVMWLAKAIVITKDVMHSLGIILNVEMSLHLQSHGYRKVAKILHQ